MVGNGDQEGDMTSEESDLRESEELAFDDNEESLKTRLMEYYKKTSPLIGYYYHAGALKPVNGLGEIEEVAAEISEALGG